MNSTLPLLEADAIGRRHPDGDRWLLHDITCRVHAGDRIAVVGPSGSGKTLLLRALALLDPVDAGQILWSGDAVRGSLVPCFRRHFVYLHQRATLLEGTVEENFRQPFSLHIHRGIAFSRERVDAWLERLGRDGSFLAKRHLDLSGGEAQLVALLRAIQLDPHVLLLDEPTAALDQEATGAVEQLVEMWYAERPDERATVWVSHDREQAGRVGRETLLIHDGQLEER
ncbi:MAG: ATP-binding cassette domain-containing protein [Planctomycetes bacterium]|nr:ATP-binding cassette domain-containing protein [Planctomycetota bacterium]MBL7042682.1 ATP-binding cassette domain-containing protein [Pirellulaceae bacterium]